MNKEALRINNLNIYYSSCHGSRIRNIISGGSKKAQPIHAIKDLSFTMYQGEVVGVIGLNGSGKTTLLRTVAGVFSPDSGEVNLYGNRASMMALGVGFDPELTGRENIFLKGQLCGLLDDEIKSLEDEIIEFADIGEYIDQPVRTYSSGMRARLGFAVNVNIRPEILIVDEALSVGDKEFRSKCLDRVNEVIENDNVTLLFVTHSTSTAKQFCKRGIYLVNGQLKYDGDIDQAIALYEDAGKAAKRRRRAKKELALAEAEFARTGSEEARLKMEEAQKKLDKARAMIRELNKVGSEQ